MRALTSDMDATIVAAIDQRLADVRRDHHVHIPWQIESGSRAWGFPSPDSDYDCRFIFLRRRTDYLSLWPLRDVIETPLDAVFDVNGWDLGKAIRLLVKGNAVVVEWLTSPIIYKGDAAFRAEFLELVGQIAQRQLIARHYRGMLRVHRERVEDRVPPPAIKKLFYALRPAMALRWLRQRPGQNVAPMHFPTLLAEADIPGPLHARIEQMLADKALTRELGRAPIPEDIRNFLRAEDELSEALSREPLTLEMDAAQALGDAFFQTMLTRYEPVR